MVMQACNQTAIALISQLKIFGMLGSSVIPLFAIECVVSFTVCVMPRVIYLTVCPKGYILPRIFKRE